MVDWKAIFEAALDVGVTAAKTSAPELEVALKAALKQHMEAIKEIAMAYVTDDIDLRTFKESMADDAKTLRNELPMLTVKNKAGAQRAVNAFRDSFIDGIEKRFPAIT